MEECTCPTKALTLRTFRDGTMHYCYQCIICGRAGTFLKKADAEKLISDGEPVSPYDDTKVDRYYDLRQRQFQAEKELAQAEREMASEERKQDYHAYLQSVNWRVIRNKVLKRCNGICEGCAESPAVHVHHKTYDNIYDELIFQLVGLCESCHKKLHPEGAAND